MPPYTASDGAAAPQHYRGYKSCVSICTKVTHITHAQHCQEPARCSCCSRRRLRSPVQEGRYLLIDTSTDLKATIGKEVLDHGHPGIPACSEACGQGGAHNALLAQKPRSSEDRLLPPLRGTGAHVLTAAYRSKPTHAVLLAFSASGQAGLRVRVPFRPSACTAAEHVPKQTNGGTWLPYP